MGPRSAFRNWRSSLETWRKMLPAKDLPTIEEVAAPTPRDKIKGRLPKTGKVVFEAVLHSGSGTGSNGIIPQFNEYLRRIGVEQPVGRRFAAGGLCFVELEAPVELANRIASFTPVRALRQMPALRILRPSFRSSRVPMQAIEMPTKGPLDPNISAAIFDGGIPNKPPITKWAKSVEPPGIGAPFDEFQKHGVGVTSAFLFGHIDPSKQLDRPYAPVDHYRVPDSTARSGPS